jgi:hypothetical protein
MKTAEVTAVHEDDAIAVLELLGVAVAYREGELVCSICELPLRENGLGAARGGSHGYVFACARPDCLDEFHRGE